MKSALSKEMAPVIDIFPDLCGVEYKPGAVRNKMKMLRDYGFTRVYLVVALPGYPMFSNAWMSVMQLGNDTGNCATESILAMGDPNFEHIYEAKRAGMEVFAVMKPYEGGGGCSIPKGRKAPRPRASVPCIGGERIGLDAFLAKNPDKRVLRKPIADYENRVSQQITTLKLHFCLDRIEDRKNDREYERYAPKPDDSIAKFPMNNIRLWTSTDNGTYQPYNKEFSVAETLVRMELTDANGVAVADGLKRCREVVLTGLQIDAEAEYFAITLGTESEHLLMLPFSMIKAYGDSGEVPITVSPYVRQRAKLADGSLNEREYEGADWFDAVYPKRADLLEDQGAQFARDGFEFEWFGSGVWGNGWMQSPCYGIARGKMNYLKGTHCEAYPEVREYWLEQVDRLIAMGVDGIDLRLQNHSGMISDYFHYGYNEPIIEAYREEYGIDILKEAAEPLKIMQIRGQFFQRFVEAAAQLLHAHGKKLQVHLRNCFEEPKLESHHGELGFWAMPKVLPDWRALMDIADEVTLKDYNFGTYNANLASKIKNHAAERGKPLWVHCYIAQGDDLNFEFFEAVNADKRVSGMLLYEVGHNPYRNNTYKGMLEVTDSGDVIVNREVHERLLGLLISEYTT